MRERERQRERGRQREREIDQKKRERQEIRRRQDTKNTSSTPLKNHIQKTNLDIKRRHINSGIFRDHWQPMMIRLDLKFGINYLPTKYAITEFNCSFHL